MAKFRLIVRKLVNKDIILPRLFQDLIMSNLKNQSDKYVGKHSGSSNIWNSDWSRFIFRKLHRPGGLRMRDGRVALFFKGKFKKKAEESENHAEQSVVNKLRVIICSGCGAENLINNNSVCEYCGSALIYIEDDRTLPSAVASQAQNATEHYGDLFHIPNTYTLTTGFYTVGLDIPVGKCDVIAISGFGNLYSSDCRINEVFGIEEEDVSSFNGLKLPKDIVLIVSGELRIKIVYKSIDAGSSGRIYDMSSAINLSTGNYEAGEDFNVGTYNIVAVSGSGNLFASEGDVNEILGFEDEDVQEIKNVYLPKGSELSLVGGLSVKLIPAVTRRLR